MRFSVLHLLKNETIKLSLTDDENKKILIKLPTVGKLHLDEDFTVAINLFILDEEVLMKEAIDKVSRLDFLNYFLLTTENQEMVIKGIGEFILNFNFYEGQMMVDSIPLNEQDLLNIKDVLKLGLGSLSFDQYENKVLEKETSKDLSEDEKRMIELEKKVQAKKTKETQSKKQEINNYSLENIILTVMYEYKLTMDEVLNLNYYTLFWYFKYAMGIHSYRIQNFALPSGAVKKIMHFTEKITKK